MSVRELYRTYLRTEWHGVPDCALFTHASPSCVRPFIVVTGACPRERPAPLARADDAAQRRLAERIRAAGFDPLPCEGSDPTGPHAEPSFWVWDVEAGEAIEWGRDFDQHAILAGDGRRHAILPCFPEDEPPIAPDLVWLADCQEGMADELRALGWTATRFESEKPSEPPMLAIGIGVAALAAADSSAPWRVAIAAPWTTLDPREELRLRSWPGLTAIRAVDAEAIVAAWLDAR